MDSYTKAKLNFMINDVVRNIQHIDQERLDLLIDAALHESDFRKNRRIAKNNRKK